MGVVVRVLTLSMSASLGVGCWAVASKVRIDSTAQLRSGESLLHHAHKTGNPTELLAAANSFAAAMTSYLPFLDSPGRAAKLLAEITPELQQQHLGPQARTMIVESLASLDRSAFLFTPLVDERVALEARLDELNDDGTTSAGTEWGAESMNDPRREAAGRMAADEVTDGMLVGLGTGSTASYAVRRLGERVHSEGLRIRGLPTSRATKEFARRCRIDLITFDDTTRVDLTIDGADEVDPSQSLIKGGGGALLREKVVASRSDCLIIVVDEAKLVTTLGLAFPLPVEVVPFAWRPVAEQLSTIGGEARLRRQTDGEPFVTDNLNWILDWRPDGGIPEPARLERQLAAIPGIVESGLFVGLTTQVIVGRSSGPEILPKC